LETIRLTESLGIDPENSDIRAALIEQLRELRDDAASAGRSDLEGALGAAIGKLQTESFSAESVLAVRVLAWRYQELAALPAGSGTHPKVRELPADRDTVRSVTESVAAELRRGLIDAAGAAADLPMESFRGSELLTPAWKAIAELRGMIEERSGGGVRFEDRGGVPLLTLGRTQAVESRAEPPSLSGWRVLVADDDAEVRWFYVGILREAGARVVEASDGARALAIARDDPPDLILADIVMPRLDGLALCTAVRREPALDGVPVVLLSWRDDFLDRMRELRPQAEDYLRKELPARQILERVAGVLEPLSRLRDSLRSEEETRGDLEDLGVSTLLRAIRRWRPDARLVLQDPWSLFEVEVRGGDVVTAKRTSIDGTVVHGGTTLQSFVGMRSGRYVVAHAEPTSVPSEGSLQSELDHATGHLGELLRALDASLDRRVELDASALNAYVRHSPRSVQAMVARLDAGESPRALLQAGGGSRAVVDALLVTLARQGAVRAVHPADSELGESVEPAAAEREPQGPQQSAVMVEPGEVTDPLEREDARAQSAVAMHREPWNRASRPGRVAWRAPGVPPLDASEDDSRFVPETTVAPRVFGVAFLVALLSTVGFLLWREGSDTAARRSAEGARPDVAQRVAAPVEPDSVEPKSRPPDRLSAYAGRLHRGVDPSLGLADSEGVLELAGPGSIEVNVDGVSRGTLPLTLVLEEGRHTIRFRIEDAWTYRLYHVRAGAVRSLRVSADPSGFVDAR